MTSGIGSICFACSRFRPGTGACEAYPNGIPNSIMFGARDHREAIEGDGGKQFVLKPGKEKQLEVYEALLRILDKPDKPD